MCVLSWRKRHGIVDPCIYNVKTFWRLAFISKNPFPVKLLGVTNMCCVSKGDKHTNRHIFPQCYSTGFQAWECINLEINSVCDFSTDINNVWSPFQPASVLYLLKSLLLPPHLSDSVQIKQGLSVTLKNVFTVAEKSTSRISRFSSSPEKIQFYEISPAAQMLKCFFVVVFKLLCDLHHIKRFSQ